MQTRQNALNKWLQVQLKNIPFSIKPITNDASFRRYFRIFFAEQTRIVMDAPPDKEPIQPFMAINAILKQQNVNTPAIYACDQEQGFIILDDFGDTLLLHKLKKENNHDNFYFTAIATLIKMQQCPTASLPIFNHDYMQYEMNLFPEWFLNKYLQLSLSDEEQTMLQNMFNLICAQLSKQPQVFIHRDYHSRNLMVFDKENSANQLGVLDFQDAMLGPITYDLISIIKDCYYKLSQKEYLEYATWFYQKQPLVHHWSMQNYLQELDICGLQRHLKILGIFCRLYLRDNKPNYLAELPLSLKYVMDCIKKYQVFNPFLNFMTSRVLEKFAEVTL